MSALPFAPGAIERHVHPRRRALARWITRIATLAACSVALGLLAGLTYGALQ